MILHLREQRANMDTATQKPQKKTAKPKVDTTGMSAGDLLSMLDLGSKG